MTGYRNVKRVARAAAGAALVLFPTVAAGDEPYNSDRIGLETTETVNKNECVIKTSVNHKGIMAYIGTLKKYGFLSEKFDNAFYEKIPHTTTSAIGMRVAPPIVFSRFEKDKSSRECEFIFDEVIDTPKETSRRQRMFSFKLSAATFRKLRASKNIAFNVQTHTRDFAFDKAFFEILRAEQSKLTEPAGKPE